VWFAALAYAGDRTATFVVNVALVAS